MPRKPAKKQRQDDDSEDDDERVLFYIPSADISMDVLIFYLERFLGHDSEASPGNNPRDREEDGYYIKSRYGLSAAMVADLKKDTLAWKKERKTRRTRASYHESETAGIRRELGASGNPTPLARTQDKAEPARRAPAQADQATGQAGNQGQRPGDRHQPNVPVSGTPLSPTPSWSQPNLQARQNQPAGNQQFAQANPYGASVPPVFVNVSTASYTQNTPVNRHANPAGQPSGMAESSDSRFMYPPAYVENEADPGQPSIGGAHGFANKPPAGQHSRHNQQ